MQAAQLIVTAERAPYGRGGETLVDTGVRRHWQIGADRVRIAGKHWPEMLASVVERAATGLVASYERRVKQRRADLDDLQRLGA